MGYTKRTFGTDLGGVWVWQSKGPGYPLVLLHGNGLSCEAFAAQMASPLAERHRLVAIDLPGHGRSADAADPATGYTLPGQAAAVGAVLAALEIDEAVLLGWSLGGHVALELAASWDGAAGVVLTGAPPATPSPAGLAAAFAPHPAAALLARETLSPEEIEQLVRVVFGAPVPDFARPALARSDGRARRHLFESLARGEATDERALVEAGTLPVAVIDGADDPLINHAYLDGLRFARLWRGRIHRIAGAGHAPFLTAPAAYNRLLAAIMANFARRAAPPARAAGLR